MSPLSTVKWWVDQGGEATTGTCISTCRRFEPPGPPQLIDSSPWDFLSKARPMVANPLSSRKHGTTIRGQACVVHG